MTTTTPEKAVGNGDSVDPDAPVVALPRKTVDKLLIGVGIVATVVFAAAGFLLMWGANFSDDYVHDELSSQNIFFPDEASLREEGRDDLVKYAGEQLTTGKQAEAYASYIGGHLEEIADGKTYSEMGAVVNEAEAALEEAEAAGAPAAEITELEGAAAKANGQRDSLFKGETLRGLLLSSYAWATIGTIAGIAMWVSFAAAVLMLILVVLGVLHVKRTT